MSEYQYYEFQAIDRPLTNAEQEMLRGLSTRARITTTSFTNQYEWGDFKGDPKRLMETCFDLHLYLANWGTRRLMMRVPKRLIDRHGLGAFLDEVDWVTLWNKAEHIIIDICRDEVEPDDDEWDDGAGWLAALEAAAAFFDIDRDLVAAAAASPYEEALAPDALRAVVSGLAGEEKNDLLMRLIEGDAHVGSELRQRARARSLGSGRPRRTVGGLRAKVREMRRAREVADAARRQAEKRRTAEEVAKARRARLDAVRRRGDSVWTEIETEIERRNASGYDRATALLADLKQLAAEGGNDTADFSRRLAAIRERHARKGQFIKRLQGLECAEYEV